MPNYVRIRDLRAVIAAIGERTDPPWWHTNMLTEVGLKVAGRVFPRTALQAALKSVWVVAQHDHDQRVGPDRYHLFRLPPEIERNLFPTPADALDIQHIEVPISADLTALITSLKEISALNEARPTEGPVQIGTVNDLSNDEWIRICAAHYLAAVEGGVRCYPYFERLEPTR